MEKVNAVYELEPVLDDPRFEGFAAERMPPSFPPNRSKRKWRLFRWAKIWRPLKVLGRVRPFNDYPCINLLHPAFSARAVDALREYLEPNGEILPLKTKIGKYYAFNATTLADVLDRRRSKAAWMNPGTAAVVVHFGFRRKVLNTLSIFRMPELPTSLFVTDRFVAKATENGLQGMNFIKVWPFPVGVNWITVEKEASERRKSAGLPACKTIKGHAVIIGLRLSSRSTEPTSAERKRIAKILDQLDKILIDLNSQAVPVGSLEGHDFCPPGMCRIFLSCPDAERLTEVLRPYLKSLDWPGKFTVAVRHSSYTNVRAKERLVSI